MPPDDAGSIATPPTAHPLPLVAALVVAGLQALVLLVYALLEAFSISGSRLTMGVTTAGFFAAAGVALGACVLAVLRRSSWGRSPLVLAQLIALGLAWSFRGGSTTWVSIVLAVAAGVVLVGLLHPRSIAWLAPSQSSSS
jgi:hypothetical protein